MSLTKEELTEINQGRTEQVKSYPIGSEVGWLKIGLRSYHKGVVVKHNRYTLVVESDGKIKKLNLSLMQVFRK